MSMVTDSNHIKDDKYVRCRDCRYLRQDPSAIRCANSSKLYCTKAEDFSRNIEECPEGITAEDIRELDADFFAYIKDLQKFMDCCPF